MEYGTVIQSNRSVVSSNRRVVAANCKPCGCPASTPCTCLGCDECIRATFTLPPITVRVDCYNVSGLAITAAAIANGGISPSRFYIVTVGAPEGTYSFNSLVNAFGLVTPIHWNDPPPAGSSLFYTFECDIPGTTFSMCMNGQWFADGPLIFGPDGWSSVPPYAFAQAYAEAIMANTTSRSNMNCAMFSFSASSQPGTRSGYDWNLFGDQLGINYNYPPTSQIASSFAFWSGQFVIPKSLNFSITGTYVAATLLSISGSVADFSGSSPLGGGMIFSANINISIERIPCSPCGDSTIVNYGSGSGSGNNSSSGAGGTGSIGSGSGGGSGSTSASGSGSGSGMGSGHTGSGSGSGNGSGSGLSGGSSGGNGGGDGGSGSGSGSSGTGGSGGTGGGEGGSGFTGGSGAVFCLPNTGQFVTAGLDDQGALCDIDNYWKYNGSPAEAPDPTWYSGYAIQDGTNYRWIGAQCDGHGQATGASNANTLTFTLPSSISPSTLSLTGTFTADNWLDAIEVNGSAIDIGNFATISGLLGTTTGYTSVQAYCIAHGISTPNDFGTGVLNDFTIPSASHFMTGSNTLTFLVGGTDDFGGMVVVWDNSCAESTGSLGSGSGSGSGSDCNPGPLPFCQSTLTPLGPIGTYTAAYTGLLFLVFNDTEDAYTDNVGYFIVNWNGTSYTVYGNDPVGVPVSVEIGTTYFYAAAGFINNGVGFECGPGGDASHNLVAPYTICPTANYGELVGILECPQSDCEEQSNPCDAVLDNLAGTYNIAGNAVLITSTDGVVTQASIGAYSANAIYQGDGIWATTPSTDSAYVGFKAMITRPSSPGNPYPNTCWWAVSYPGENSVLRVVKMTDGTPRGSYADQDLTMLSTPLADGSYVILQGTVIS